jgi:hypothetical protein
MPIFRHRFVPEGADLFQEIKNIRLRHRVSLQKISDETKIPIKYLASLEEGSVESLPDVLYTKNIIKKYLEFFNLDAKPFLSRLELTRTESESPHRAIPGSGLVVFPRVLKGAVLLIVAMALLGYLGWNIRRIFQPPEIAIYSPKNQETVTESIIEVKGRTERGTTIFINDQQVLLDKTGEFSEEVGLQKGINLIKITGVKRYSKERVVWLNINLEIK